MREVDQALARAYAERAGGERGAFPPAHHLPVRPVDPERVAGPCAAGRPAVTLHWPALVRALERSYGDRFDRVADALVAARDLRGTKTVLFTSCHRAEGRTTLVLALARALARKPGRTLLVDADLTGPMLARQLGLRPALGLDDVIDGGLSLAEALVEAPDDHLTVLPLRAPVVDPRAFSGGPGWSCALARLRRDFDLVVLDGGPVFNGLSAAAPVRSVDAAVLVHNPSVTGDRALLRARAALESAGIPLLGLAETFVA
jgi:Mrp family chromosome partitioning ATPase